MIRYYLVPQIGTGASDDARRPKYIADHVPPLSWSGMDYGNEPLFLVGADVDGPQHTAIAANPDVLAAPVNMYANTVGGALATLQADLEEVNIPADWITAGTSYGTVLNWIGRLFFIAQRYQGKKWGRIFDGDTLDKLISALTPTRRQRFKAAAQSLGLDTSDVQGSDTVRQALKKVVGQVTLKPMAGGQEI